MSSGRNSLRESLRNSDRKNSNSEPKIFCQIIARFCSIFAPKSKINLPDFARFCKIFARILPDFCPCRCLGPGKHLHGQKSAKSRPKIGQNQDSRPKSAKSRPKSAKKRPNDPGAKSERASAGACRCRAGAQCCFSLRCRRRIGKSL